MAGLWAIANSLGVAMELSGVITVTITSIVTDRPVSNLLSLMRTDQEKLENTGHEEMTPKETLPMFRPPETKAEYYDMRRKYLKEALGAGLLFFGLGLQLVSSFFLEGLV
ncbi:MAG: hypothetical protein J07AB43_09610 [Candidatus Nanosalina sp. J07AB43]|jgi:hypothetical protein|nr:MAG: hypothetical protein J07AB43_09610 [Candidatus Nanosalina sp. J07AB43]